MKVCSSSQPSLQVGKERLFDIYVILTFIQVNNCSHNLRAYFMLGPVQCVFRVVIKIMNSGLRHGLEYLLEFTVELYDPGIVN